MSHFSEFDFSLRGFTTPEQDRKERAAARVEREKTLAKMGINSLDPYGSALMTATSNSKESGTGKGNWRDGPRQVARRNGVSRYWGRPCKAKHDSPRYVSTGQCVECMTLRWKAGPAAI